MCVSSFFSPWIENVPKHCISQTLTGSEDHWTQIAAHHCAPAAACHCCYCPWELPRKSSERAPKQKSNRKTQKPKVRFVRRYCQAEKVIGERLRSKSTIIGRVESVGEWGWESAWEKPERGRELHLTVAAEAEAEAASLTFQFLVQITSRAVLSVENAEKSKINSDILLESTLPHAISDF